jgi:hypothetical protein
MYYIYIYILYLQYTNGNPNSKYTIYIALFILVLHIVYLGLWFIKFVILKKEHNPN